jgi:hypothetical protein
MKALFVTAHESESGPSRHIAPPQDQGRFRSKADIRPQATGVTSVAIDPEQTSHRSTLLA